MSDGLRSVWVLTEGSYSEYSIRGVYSTEEKARAVLDEHKKAGRYCDFNDPEEWELDADLDWLVGPVFGVFIALESGEVLIQDRRPSPIFRHPERCHASDPFRAPGGPVQLYVVSPISYEHAEKVAIEKRQEWLRGRA